MKPKIGLSIGRYQKLVGDDKALSIAAEIGCDTVDFNLNGYSLSNADCPYAGSDAEIEAYFIRLGEKARSLGLAVSQTHGRMRGFCFDAAADAELLSNARLDMLATAALGAKICVIHSITSIHAGFGRAPEEMRAENLRMYREILPFAKRYGTVVAMETFGDATDASGANGCDFFGDPKEFLRAYQTLLADPEYRDCVCLCMDTGHTNKAARFGHPAPGELIRMLGRSIRILHLNDNDGVFDQHKIPLTGTIDWDDVFAALSESGYEGVYNMELHLDAFGRDIGMMRETGAFAVKVLRAALSARGNA